MKSTLFENPGLRVSALKAIVLYVAGEDYACEGGALAFECTNAEWAEFLALIDQVDEWLVDAGLGTDVQIGKVLVLRACKSRMEYNPRR